MLSFSPARHASGIVFEISTMAVNMRDHATACSWDHPVITCPLHGSQEEVYTGHHCSQGPRLCP